MLMLFTYLCSCCSTDRIIKNQENNITITTICRTDLPEHNKLPYILRESANSSTVKLSRILFDYENGTLIRKIEFDPEQIRQIQNYYNILINDISRIFFTNDKKGINLEIKESLNPSTSCRTNKLRVTPYFLQVLLEESLGESIKRNTQFFEGRNSIKNVNDYFEILRHHEQERKLLDSNDESIALEFQRTNIFVSYEFMKAFTFIFGHELCHFFTKCELGHQFEYDSDLLGVLAFQFMNLLIHYNFYEIAECHVGYEFNELINSKDSSEIVALILGSNLDKIVERIYRKTDFEKESITHPPLEKRLKIIKELLKQQDPDEIYHKLLNKNILKLTSNEESIYYKLSSGGNFIFNSCWLFPKSDG